MKYEYFLKDSYYGECDKFTDFIKDTIPQKLSYRTKYYSYDFNNGFRIQFINCSQDYYIVIRNKNTKYQYFRGYISPKRNTIYSYIKKYYIEYEISIHLVHNNIPDCYPYEVITFDTTNKDILMLISASSDPCGLGDGIAWLQSVIHFQNKNPNTNIYVCTSNNQFDELIKYYIPNFNIISIKDIKNKSFYATYVHGCFFNDDDRNYNPIDFHLQSLVSMGYNVLGIEEDINTPALYFKEKNNNITKPYICMSLHASGIFKEWLPDDNEIEFLIETLKSIGYDVYIIDKESESKSNNLIKTKIPSNAIDMTGKHITLKERADFLSRAEFFIGLSSGLSWLAWSTGIPVIMISGFTNPITEFYTPYRIINYTKCNSCWNDLSENNILNNPCPRKENVYSEEYLECSTSITSLMVLDKIFQIPCVREKINGMELCLE